MKIAVIGTGYVGLVSGVCLAEKGHDVTCVDRDAAKLDRIARGEPPIYEAGLETLLRRNIGRRLQVTTDLAEAVAASDLSLVAVGTPFDGSHIDLGAVAAVTREIGAALARHDRYHVVVVKSTVVPGTTDGLVRRLLEQASGRKAGADFGLGMNPEFLKEGEAVADFMQPDRIVLGGIDERTLDTMEAVYRPFTGVDVIRTGTATAEMIKYTSNALLATLISFSNEIGNLCADLGGIDALEVMRGVQLDRRLSPILEDGRRVVPPVTSYLRAGCGFGGSCFPKDVKALVAHGQAIGNAMRLLDAVIAVNRRQPERILALLRKHHPELDGIQVAVLGLAFKPGTDDLRESPSLPVLAALREQGARVRAYDPVATVAARQRLGDDGIVYCDGLAESLQGADAVLLMTAWDEFRQVPELLRDVHPSPVVVDGRRLLPRDSVPRYEGIGV